MSIATYALLKKDEFVVAMRKIIDCMIVHKASMSLDRHFHLKPHIIGNAKAKKIAS